MANNTADGADLGIGGLSGRSISGRFRILDVVSAGANTIITDAVDDQTNQPVTLKIVRPELAASDEFRRAFRRSAEVATALTHPNIATVVAWGDVDLGSASSVFWVVEYLGGGSMRDLADRGRLLDPSQALVLGLEACRALDVAHQRGIVHTELTPSKMVFGDDRRLRVVDFGMARLLAAEAWKEPATVPTHVARYASPEQALGIEVDAKTDVYALALSLIEAVTGKVPFAADSTVATLAGRIGKLMSVSADLGSLAAVLERAGRPEPEDRYSAAELGRALVQAAEKLPRPEPIPIIAGGLFATSELRRPTDPTGGLARPDEPVAPGAAPIAAPGAGDGTGDGAADGDAAVGPGAAGGSGVDATPGAAEDGAVVDRADEDGAVVDGAGADGSVEDGAGVDGAAEDGAAEDDGPADDGPAHGPAAEGPTVDDGAGDRSAVDVVAEDGAAVDGAAADVGVVAGGAVDGAGEDRAAADGGGAVGAPVGGVSVDDGAGDEAASTGPGAGDGGAVDVPVAGLAAGEVAGATGSSTADDASGAHEGGRTTTEIDGDRDARRDLGAGAAVAAGIATSAGGTGEDDPDGTPGADVEATAVSGAGAGEPGSPGDVVSDVEATAVSGAGAGDSPDGGAAAAAPLIVMTDIADPPTGAVEVGGTDDPSGAGSGAPPATIDPVAPAAAVPPAAAPTAATPDSDAAGTEVYDDERSGRRVGAIVLLTLVVLAGLAALAFAGWQLLRTKSFDVPELAGVNEDVALNEISGNGWLITIERERNDSEPTIDNVIRTVPGPGVSLEEGSDFLMVVSDGPELRTLPELAEVAVTEADAVLRALRLIPVIEEREFSETVPPDAVISWRVEGDDAAVAGTRVLPDTTILLTVSDGPAPRSVPDVTGLTIEEATAAVDGLQLVLVRGEDVFSDDVPLGVIVSQEPVPAILIDRGASVTVRVSKGPDVVPVPDLTGLSYADAERLLLDTGFTIGNLLGTTDGTFVSLSIGGESVEVGQTFPRGTPVDLIFL